MRKGSRKLEDPILDIASNLLGVGKEYLLGFSSKVSHLLEKIEIEKSHARYYQISAYLLAHFYTIERQKPRETHFFSQAMLYANRRVDIDGNPR